MGTLWGVFAVPFTFRVGYACQQQYEKIKKGKHESLTFDDLTKEPLIPYKELEYNHAIWSYPCVQEVVKNVEGWLEEFDLKKYFKAKKKNEE